MSLFDTELTTVDIVVLLVIFISIAIITFFVAEYFRKKPFIAAYVYIILFLILLPFNMVNSSIFLKIKYIIVNIPYILIILSLIAIIPLSSLQTNEPRCCCCAKLNIFLHKLCTKIFKFTVIPSESNDNDSIYGYATWYSWFFWVMLVINVLVVVVGDFSNGYITNPICGILLCLPFNYAIPIKKLAVSQNSNKPEYYLSINKQYNEFEFRLDSISFLWIITYTSWDLCLLFGGAGNLQIFLFGAIHLGVPICRCLMRQRNDLYLHWRAFALGIALLLQSINGLDSVQLNKASIIDVDQTKIIFFMWGSLNCLGAVINLIMQIIAFYQNKQRNHLAVVNINVVDVQSETMA